MSSSALMEAFLYKARLALLLSCIIAGNRHHPGYRREEIV